MNKYTCVFSNNLKKQRCGWKMSTELVHISRRISVILIMRFSVALQLTYFCSSCSQACKLFVTCGWNLQFIAMLDCQSLILIKAISNNQQHQHFPWYEEQFFWASDVSETAFLKYILFSHFCWAKTLDLKNPRFWVCWQLKFCCAHKACLYLFRLFPICCTNLLYFRPCYWRYISGGTWFN